MRNTNALINSIKNVIFKIFLFDKCSSIYTFNNRGYVVASNEMVRNVAWVKYKRMVTRFQQASIIIFPARYDRTDRHDIVMMFDNVCKDTKQVLFVGVTC